VTKKKVTEKVKERQMARKRTSGWNAQDSCQESPHKGKHRAGETHGDVT